MGGSSSINGMFFMRGHSRDFDGWQESGCEGWSYAHVLPYFKNSNRAGAAQFRITALPVPCPSRECHDQTPARAPDADRGRGRLLDH
jgi:choline dehydrogenase